MPTLRMPRLSTKLTVADMPWMAFQKGHGMLCSKGFGSVPRVAPFGWGVLSKGTRDTGKGWPF